MPANQVMKPKKKNIPQPLALRRPLRFLAGGKQLKLVVHSGIGIVNGTITNHIENYYVGSRDDVESELLPKVPYQRSEESYITNIHKEIKPRWMLYFSGVVLAVLLMQFVVFAIYLTLYSSPALTNQVTFPVSPDGKTEAITVEGKNVPGAPRMFERSFWVAQPPVCAVASNTLPVKRVIVCHTATEECPNTPDCVLKMRYIQQFQVESQDWCDIVYNFVIAGDGVVYEARGWDSMGSLTNNNVNGSLEVAFLGTFINKMPSLGQIQAFHKLMRVGLAINKISEDYTLVAQCQLVATAAPGWTLAQNMTSWPHFDHSLPVQCTTPQQATRYKEDL